jgi:hypothetical protein
MEVAKQLDDTRKQLKDIQSELADTTSSLLNKNGQINALAATIQSQTDQIAQLNLDELGLKDQLAQLEAQVPDPIPYEIQERILYYYSKYPQADIAYGGRYLGSNVNDTYSMDVKVWALEGQNDQAILKHLRVKGCKTVSELMQTGLGFHEACDMAVLLVWNALPVNYYFDQQIYSSGEYWAFASELFAETYQKNRGGDCEDHAHLRHIGYRMMDVPAGLLRIVCGYTNNDQGHSTNYYFTSDKKWHHVNSTSSADVPEITQTPLDGDANDTIGIKLNGEWFSFNENYAFHQFATGAKESFLNEQSKDKSRFKKITITPR